MADSITCPDCKWTSHSPRDIQEGYCGSCHNWTGVGSDPDWLAKHIGDRMWSAAELKRLPTIVVGQDADLKVSQPDLKVWLSRMTPADGAPYSNQVFEERLNDHGVWVHKRSYRG